MYRYRYINKHYQFGCTNYSLILQDLEDGMPDVRVEKCFSMPPDQIDDDFLAMQANADILNAIQSYSNTLIAAEFAADELAAEEASNNGDS